MKIKFEGARAVRPHPWLDRASQLGSIFGLLLFSSAIFAASFAQVTTWLAIAALAIAIVALFAWTSSLRPKLMAPLFAAREGLFQGERLVVPRRTVRGAYGAVGKRGPMLILLTTSGSVFVHVADMDTARRLEEALGSTR